MSVHVLLFKRAVGKRKMRGLPSILSFLQRVK